MQQRLINNIEFFSTVLLVFILGISLPLVLIPVVHILGYSEIIEELTKGIVVVFLVMNQASSNKRFLTATLFGLLFGISENLFLLSNLVGNPDLSIFWLRFVTTVPMHVLTTLVIWSVIEILKTRKAIALGIPLAIGIHLLFNTIVGLL